MGLTENRSSRRVQRIRSKGALMSVNAVANPAILDGDLEKMLDLTMDDLGGLLLKIDARFRRFMVQQFETEGASGGKPWPKLSERYKRFKEKRKPGKKIMNWSGKTRASLTSKKHKEHIAYSYMKPRPAVVVGTARGIPASYHTPLSALKNPNLPDRDVMQMTSKQEGELLAFAVALMKAKQKEFVRAAMRKFRYDAAAARVRNLGRGSA